MNKWLTRTVDAYIEKYGKVPHPIIYEIGSRDGDDAVELGQLIGTSTPELVAVEANPECAKRIANKYPEIRLHSVAVSDFIGEANFIVFKGSKGDVGSSSLRLDWKKGELRGEIIRVPVERLENLLEHQEIDIMKIDVEGKSLEVLRGMGGTIRRVKVYHIETENKEIGRQIQLGKLLERNGYELIAVENEYKHLDDQIWRQK